MSGVGKKPAGGVLGGGFLVGVCFFAKFGGAVAAFLVGEADLMQTAQLVFTALIGAFVRNGIK